MAAQNEARAANNDEIAPEHLALGLLNEPEALGAGTIVAQGVALETVRRTVTSRLPPATGHVPDLIPFDSQARKALELTFREALRLGRNYIRTEHILLALLELEDGPGVLAASASKRGRPKPKSPPPWPPASRSDLDGAASCSGPADRRAERHRARRD